MKNEIKNCPSTLTVGYSSYSPAALKRLFDGQKVCHVLSYLPMEDSEEDATKFLKNAKYISISGAQEKYGLVMKNHELVLSDEDEISTYMLKPKPSALRLPNEMPANEHLTMQIAEQVYGIETAANGLCFFSNGEVAYVTRRFDVAKDGTKWRMEDFASLAGIASGGASDAKYDYSYEEIAELIQKFIPAWRVELVKYFRQVLFNFLFSNGDAHLKNFSVIETSDGDFKLSPAYDMLNTRLHIDDADFALTKGLFKVDNPTDFKMGTQVNGATFKAFGLKIGLPSKVVDKELAFFGDKHVKIKELVEHSFLSKKTKRAYLMQYNARRNKLADFKL